MVRMLLVLATILLIQSQHGSADWMPPETPDVEQILREANEDSLAQNYEAAFEKLVWIYEETKLVRPNHIVSAESRGVNQLCGLADQYEPAEKKVNRIRMRAVASMKKSRQLGLPEFYIVAAIDNHRGDSAKLVKAFEAYARQYPGYAYIAFDKAQRAIINAERYDLVQRYLVPFFLLTQAESLFKSEISILERQPDSPITTEDAVNLYRDNVSTTVALLAKTNRIADAQRAMTAAKTFWSKAVKEYGVAPDALDSSLQDALTGKIPASAF